MRKINCRKVTIQEERTEMRKTVSLDGIPIEVWNVGRGWYFMVILKNKHTYEEWRKCAVVLMYEPLHFIKLKQWEVTRILQVEMKF